MDTTVKLHIVEMTRAHAGEAARLHQQGIQTGFLSSLGEAFLRQMYAALASCSAGFGYVGMDDTGRVFGFIACSQSTGKLYVQASLRRGLLMALALARFLLRPSVVKRIWQTLRYPADTRDMELPAAEVLSIAVSGEARGRGVGKALINAAMAEFERRGIHRVRVAVWSGNEPANRFYVHVGFTMAGTREHHGLPMNIYVRSTRSADARPAFAQ